MSLVLIEGVHLVLHHLQRVGDEGEGPLPGQPAAALHLHQAGADRHPSVCAGVRRPSKWLNLVGGDMRHSLQLLCFNGNLIGGV